MKSTIFATPEEAVKKLLEEFCQKKGVFAQRINIEGWVPSEWSDKDKETFLFLASVLDYDMRSTILYQGARKLFSDKSEFLQAKFWLLLQVVKKD